VVLKFEREVRTRKKEARVMKFTVLMFLVAIAVVASNGLENKDFKARKAQLILELNKDAAYRHSSSHSHHHSHSHSHSDSHSHESRERRKIRRMGIYEYCLRYPNRIACMPVAQPRPFPFNLLGKK
jgi:ABC-type Zn2+ transport system substrate-binding protein/surface adhesin